MFNIFLMNDTDRYWRKTPTMLLILRSALEIKLHLWYNVIYNLQTQP